MFIYFTDKPLALGDCSKAGITKADAHGGRNVQKGGAAPDDCQQSDRVDTGDRSLRSHLKGPAVLQWIVANWNGGIVLPNDLISHKKLEVWIFFFLVAYI